MSSLASQIVKIFEQKLFSIRSAEQGDLYETCGRDELLKQVQGFITDNRRIQLLLPAFPCKSPNLEKVSGKLPDAGELYALEYLNDICREISLLYQPGCDLKIWSDGGVFGDLIAVPEEDIATYVRLLQYYSMTMSHIEWDSMNNYVNLKQGETLIGKYGSKTFSFEQWLLKSEDNRQQYVHLRRFIEKDLNNVAEYKKISRRQFRERMKLVAEEMITRNEALGNLLKQHYSNHIRLSIHQHVNDGRKFTIRFFAQNYQQSEHQSILRTPWHNSFVINADGTPNIVSYRQLNLESEHVPIMFKNQIWCFVQLPKDSPLSLASKLKLSFLGQSPRFGLAIDLNKEVNVVELDSNWMKMLLQKFGLVVLRRCQQSFDKDSYVQFCETFGESVMWKFGPLLPIKPEAEASSGHESREMLPLHFDLSYPPDYLRKTGLYKDYVPQYLMLYCVQAPLEQCGGKTTFVNGRLLLESMKEEDILEWKTMDISSITRRSYFGGQTYTYPMIMSHPKTNENILRFSERSNTVSQPIESQGSINGSIMDSTEFDQFNRRMEKKLRDPNWYIEHSWNNDDLVLVENHLLLHGRTAIENDSERELWRVQVY